MPDPNTLTPEFEEMLDALAEAALLWSEQNHGSGLARLVDAGLSFAGGIEAARKNARSRVLAEIERHVAAERERAKPVVESLDHARERLADVEMIHEDAYRFLFKGDRPLSAVFRALDAYKEPRP